MAASKATLGTSNPFSALISRYASRIGTDESGKGDYFGPLVIAAVYVEPAIEARLKELGVKDSKRLTDPRAEALSREIKRIAPNEVVRIGPQRYNELIDKMKNLNRLLAWGHARAIEELLKRVQCDVVIADQFGDERLIERALFEKGKHVELIQAPRAEADVAVAAASVLARAAFLEQLRELSLSLGVTIPKGASPAAEATAVQLVRQFGPDVLKRTTKYHFKTTQRVLAAAAAS